MNNKYIITPNTRARDAKVAQEREAKAHAQLDTIVSVIKESLNVEQINDMCQFLNNADSIQGNERVAEYFKNEVRHMTDCIVVSKKVVGDLCYDSNQVDKRTKEGKRKHTFLQDTARAISVLADRDPSVYDRNYKSEDQY